MLNIISGLLRVPTGTLAYNGKDWSCIAYGKSLPKAIKSGLVFYVIHQHECAPGSSEETLHLTIGARRLSEAPLTAQVVPQHLISKHPAVTQTQDQALTKKTQICECEKPDANFGVRFCIDEQRLHRNGHAALRRSFRLSKRGKKTNKSMYECKKSERYDTADVPTYEEVTPYCRAPGARYRLVVLVAFDVFNFLHHDKFFSTDSGHRA
ncbi:MAGUK p55 subfamily member 7 [Tachysurus ichikawai]